MAEQLDSSCTLEKWITEKDVFFSEKKGKDLAN